MSNKSNNGNNMAEQVREETRISPEAIDSVVNSLTKPTYKMGMRYAHFLAANSLDDNETSLRVWNELKDKAHADAVAKREQAGIKIPERITRSAFLDRKLGRYVGKQTEVYSGLKPTESAIRQAMAKSKAQMEKTRIAQQNALKAFLEEQTKEKSASLAAIYPESAK